MTHFEKKKRKQTKQKFQSVTLKNKSPKKHDKENLNNFSRSEEFSS